MAVSVQVPRSHAHARLRPSEGVERQTQGEGALLEAPRDDLHPGEVRLPVIGHVDVRAPVPVEVAQREAEPLAHAAGDAGLGAHVAEGPVALVAIEDVGETGEALRTGEVGQTVRAAAGRFVVVLEVASHEQVEEPVAVVVEETGRGAPAGGRHSRCLGDLLETTVAVVPE